MLYSVSPLALIHASICPQHLTIAVPFILEVITFVDVAACPSEDTLSLLLVIVEFTFVGVAIMIILQAFPLAFSFFFAVREISDEVSTIWPAIFSLSVCLAILKFSRVCLTVCKGVSALAMF